MLEPHYTHMFKSAGYLTSRKGQFSSSSLQLCNALAYLQTKQMRIITWLRKASVGFYIHLT